MVGVFVLVFMPVPFRVPWAGGAAPPPPPAAVTAIATPR